MAVPVGMPDHALLTRARDGDGEAFEALYRRHHRAATRAAHSYSSRSQLAEDAVQEAFMRILHATKEGGGPITEFRAYLATTVRHVIAGWTRGERTIATDELETLAGEDQRDTSKPESRLRWHLLTKAFRSLPTRWQEALWLGEVEGVSPAELAERWNMSANSAAALSYRAREGLRTAWLDAHVNEGLVPDDCRTYVTDLSRYTQGKLTDRRETQVRTHLDDCEYCRAVLFEVDTAASELRVLLLPVALWGGSALAGAGLSLGPVAWLAKRIGLLSTRGLALGAASTATVVVSVVAMNPGAADPLGAADDGRTFVVSTADDGSHGDSGSSSDDPTVEPTGSETGDSTTTPGDADAEPTGPTLPTTSGPSTTVTTPVDAPPRRPSPTVPAPIAPPVTEPTEEPEEVPAAPDITYQVTESGLIELSGTGEPGATITVAAADTGTSGGTTGTRSVVPRAPLALPGTEVATATVATDGTWSVQPDLDAVAGLTVVAIQTVNELESPVSEPVRLPARPAPPTITGPAPPVELPDRLAHISGTGQPGATVLVLGPDATVLPAAEVDDSGQWYTALTLTPGLAETEMAAIQVANGLRSLASPPSALPSYPLAMLRIDAVTVAEGQIQFTGSGEPGASVEVTDQGAVLVAGTVDDQGTWALGIPIDVNRGGSQVTATQTYVGLSSQSLPITIPDIPPAPTVTLEIVVGDHATLVGLAEPGAQIVLRTPSGEHVGQSHADAELPTWSLGFADPRIADGLTVVAVQIVDGIESAPSPAITLGPLH